MSLIASPTDSVSIVRSDPFPWRLVRYQPDYRLCKKWREQILNPKLGAGRRKQLIVALARGFGVDWWRLCTGQTTAEKLGLVLAD